MPAGNEFLNIFDAAALLGVHVQTLRKLARQKKVPSMKIGKDWKFRKEALLRWADEQHSVTTAAPCSVVVVDDDEVTCRALSRALSRFGCRARLATAGADGLELVALEAPDLVLLDLLMPDMSGPQFLAKLRETHPLVPVVIVTGYPDGELMKQAAQYAPVLLLPKPVEQELLERTVRTVIGENLSSTSTARRPDGVNP